MTQVFIHFPAQSHQHMSETSTHINPFREKSDVSFPTLSNEAANTCWVKKKTKPNLNLSYEYATARLVHFSAPRLFKWIHHRLTFTPTSSTCVSGDLYLSSHGAVDEWVDTLINSSVCVIMMRVKVLLITQSRAASSNKTYPFNNYCLVCKTVFHQCWNTKAKKKTHNPTYILYIIISDWWYIVRVISHCFHPSKRVTFLTLVLSC